MYGTGGCGGEASLFQHPRHACHTCSNQLLTTVGHVGTKSLCFHSDPVPYVPAASAAAVDVIGRGCVVANIKGQSKHQQKTLRTLNYTNNSL